MSRRDPGAANTQPHRRKRNPFRQQVPGVDKPPPKLRDAASICPAALTLSTGVVLVRCELDVGHDGVHKGGCTSWASQEVK